jgi:hypothetical protein
LSEELGLADTFMEVATQELDLSRRSLARLRKDAARIVAEAAASARPADA